MSHLNTASLHTRFQKASNPRAGLVIGGELSITAVMLVFISGRFYMRAYLKKRLAVDDWVMGFAALIAVVVMAMHCIETRFAIGFHVWNVRPAVYLLAARMGFATFILLMACTSLTKLSMCLTYLRILATKRDKLFCYCVSIIIACSWLSVTISFGYSCGRLPPNLKYSKPPINNTAAVLTFSTINSVTDFLVFLWPARTLWTIRLPTKQRCGLVFVFAFGCIVCIAGVVRIWYFVRYIRSNDKTYEIAILYMVSAIEANFGIICGCLPSLKPLLARYFHGFFGSSYDRVAKPYDVHLDDQSRTTVQLDSLPSARGNGRPELARSLSGHSMQKMEAQWLASGGGIVADLPKVASVSISVRADPQDVGQVENGLGTGLGTKEIEIQEWIARPESVHLNSV
ncbi:hypothetical protein K432DRAFT_408566 [Lepidopterella palustris CBS 459.81]|uniref:Rhodopsin domain-containing protein n=1 Tax=Lepidopterella palustris CBS 459.81 TaxID=1314670 RepID=A0A8E2E2B5_9PEZI|nr:hypothetical protein K432DRAFT_408566 [Lepidopterella palustris CBS 459.81]